MELLIVILFIWLMVKVIGLALRMAWSVTKVAACVLFGLAVPLLLGSLLFAGGLLILIPLALVSLAFGLLKGAV